MSDPQLQEVMDFLEHCRKTHVDWLAHIRECEYCRTYNLKLVGDEQQQQECIDGYDKTLALIRELTGVTT